MNAKTRQEIDKRISQMAEPTKEQIRKLEERIQKHKTKYGELEHQGILKRLCKHFF